MNVVGQVALQIAVLALATLVTAGLIYGWVRLLANRRRRQEISRRTRAKAAWAARRAALGGGQLPSLVMATGPATVALVLAMLAAVVPDTGLARDLGVRGPLHPITEPDLLKEMMDVMRAKQASGDLQRLQEDAKRRAIARVESPPAVPGLRRTVKARSFLYDPSVRFDESIVDHQGRIVIPAGTVGNPLQTVRLTRELFFFDGRDPDQVKLAKARLDELGSQLKPILVAGQPLALTRLWKSQVFFDQDGQLVQRFGIRQVPARVTQEGLRLKVEELAL